MADTSEKLESLQIKGIDKRTFDGTGMRIGIVHTRWNAKVVNTLVSSCKKELLDSKVAGSDIVTYEVPGSFELPYAASRMILSQNVDAVICIGLLVKGSTMHFEYICEAVSQGIMRLNLESGCPVIFGVLTCLTEEQALERAGMTEHGHNHGPDWAQGALEMAQLRKDTQ